MPAALAVVARRVERPGVKVILPGRLKPFEVCHSRMAWETCNECLRGIAEFLAAESDYDLQAALNKTAESWWAELGGVCSLRRARELELMTAAICYRRVRGEGAAAAMFVAGLDAQVGSRAQCPGSSEAEPRANRMPRWRRVMWAALVVWLAACAVVIVWGRH